MVSVYALPVWLSAALQVVDGQYAFVLHTANPLTGRHGDMFGELVAGLGEVLVSLQIIITLCVCLISTPVLLLVASSMHALSALRWHQLSFDCNQPLILIICAVLPYRLATTLAEL